VWNRVIFYSRFIWAELGPIFGTLTLVGCIEAFRTFRRKDESQGSLALALVALAMAAFLFHVFNPHRVPAERYLVMALPPLWALVPRGIVALLRVARTNQVRQTQAIAFASATIMALIVAPPVALARPPLGYAEVAGVLEGRDGLAGRRILVVA